MPVSARDGFGLRPQAAALCGSVGTECAKQSQFAQGTVVLTVVQEKATRDSDLFVMRPNKANSAWLLLTPSVVKEPYG